MEVKASPDKAVNAHYKLNALDSIWKALNADIQGGKKALREAEKDK
jgi:hypothetical protein